MQRPKPSEYILKTRVAAVCDSVYYDIKESDPMCPAADHTGKILPLDSATACKGRMGDFWVANETSGHEMALCKACYSIISKLPDTCFKSEPGAFNAKRARKSDAVQRPDPKPVPAAAAVPKNPFATRITHDQLRMLPSLSKDELKKLLTHNNQADIGVKAKLQQRIIDAVKNGNLGNCPRCRVGKLTYDPMYALAPDGPYYMCVAAPKGEDWRSPSDRTKPLSEERRACLQRRVKNPERLSRWKWPLGMDGWTYKF